MRLVIASDHAGLALKNQLLEKLRADNLHTVDDLGTYTLASVDYPDFAVLVAKAVSSGQADRGILVCGTGQGMAMTANRIAGVRAAVVGDCFTAKATREHNNANVLCLGERVTGVGLALEILDLFLKTDFAGGRHAGRVAKITALDF
jgi:ribose 5-phosphate isomerase B